MILEVQAGVPTTTDASFLILRCETVLSFSFCLPFCPPLLNSRSTFHDTVRFAVTFLVFLSDG
jgi:hypothetical protein